MARRVQRIGHVQSYNPTTGHVSCYHTEAWEYWITGTIRTSGSNPYCLLDPERQFDIVLTDTSGVTDGTRLYITYEDLPGTQKPVRAVRVVPPPAGSVAVAFSMGGVNFSSQASVSAAPTAVTPEEEARWHDKLPSLESETTIDLFDSVRISASTGRRAIADELEPEVPVSEVKRAAAPPANGSAAPQGNGAARPSVMP
jgi:hypothetical protein